MFQTYEQTTGEPAVQGTDVCDDPTGQSKHDPRSRNRRRERLPCFKHRERANEATEQENQRINDTGNRNEINETNENENDLRTRMPRDTDEADVQLASSQNTDLGQQQTLSKPRFPNVPTRQANPLYSVPFQVCSRSASDDLHVKSKPKIKATFYEITPAKNDRLAPHLMISPRPSSFTYILWLCLPANL